MLGSGCQCPEFRSKPPPMDDEHNAIIDAISKELVNLGDDFIKRTPEQIIEEGIQAVRDKLEELGIEVVDVTYNKELGTIVADCKAPLDFKDQEAVGQAIRDRMRKTSLDLSTAWSSDPNPDPIEDIKRAIKLEEDFEL